MLGSNYEDALLAISKDLAIDKRYGRLTYKKQDYFFKKVDAGQISKEIGGSAFISRYYPTPKLICSSLREGIVIFEFEPSVGRNRGLIIDALIDPSVDFVSLSEPILSLYCDVFSRTLCLDSGESSDIFFRDRIGNRLMRFYDDSFWGQNVTLNLNGNAISIDMVEMKRTICEFFASKSKFWCVAAQCDPGDLNIGLKPTIFDCTGGGLVPVMAEFAVFFWYQVAQGNYFSPKYHEAAFLGHERVHQQTDTVSLVGSTEILHKVHRRRRIFLENYIRQVVEPIMEKVVYPDWYEDFCAFLTMRILAVFDISRMERKDTLLYLAYLALYTQKARPTRPSDLLNFVYDS